MNLTHAQKSILDATKKCAESYANRYKNIVESYTTKLNLSQYLYSCATSMEVGKIPYSQEKLNELLELVEPKKEKLK